MLASNFISCNIYYDIFREVELLVEIVIQRKQETIFEIQEYSCFFLKQNNVACVLFSSWTRQGSDHKSIVIRIGGEGNLLSDDTKQYIIAHAQQINK